jgi:hypothetical protein
MRAGVYVLRLQRGRVYVGASSDIDARVASHRAGRGSAFTRAFPVVAEEEPATRAMDDYESWERAETLWRVREHGRELVRGWMWTTVRMSAASSAEITRQLAERFAACRACGSLDHFIGECDRRASGPMRSRRSDRAPTGPRRGRASAARREASPSSPVARTA